MLKTQSDNAVGMALKFALYVADLDLIPGICMFPVHHKE